LLYADYLPTAVCGRKPGSVDDNAMEVSLHDAARGRRCSIVGICDPDLG
jgi:hypothetical protein